MWIIAKFLKPVIPYVAGIAAILILVQFARQDAADDARLVCEKRVSDATSAEVIRQQRAIADTLLAYELEAADAAVRMETLKGTANELISELKARGVSCPIPPDLLDRLSGIE